MSSNQQLLAAGGDAKFVTSVVMDAFGSGYTYANVSFIASGAGSGANATANLGNPVGGWWTNGWMSSISGSGGAYTVAPEVIFSGGGGTGASATAVLSATSNGSFGGNVGTVVSVNSNTSWFGTTSGAACNITQPGSNNNAYATPSLSATGSITSYTNYQFSSVQGLTIADVIGGGGSGATASLTYYSQAPNRYVSSPVVSSAGSWGGGRSLTMNNASGNWTTQPTFTYTVNGSNVITSISITSVGIWSPVSGGPPATDYEILIDAHLGGWLVGSCSLLNYHIYGCQPLTLGSGYTSDGSLSVSGRSPSALIVQNSAAYVSKYIVWTVTTPGTGYTNAACTINTGSAVFSGYSGNTGNPYGTITTSPYVSPTYTYPVASVTFGASGSGYTSAVSASFSTANGSGGTVTPVMSYSYYPVTYSVVSITLNSGGTVKYSPLPQVSITGDGSGAYAHAT